MKKDLENKVKAFLDLSFNIRIKVLAKQDIVSAIGLREKFSFVNEKVLEAIDNAFFALTLDKKRRSFQPRQQMNRENTKTNVEQYAFVGCHLDIRGGNSNIGLLTISLLQMILRIWWVSEARFDKDTLLQFIATYWPSRFSLKRDNFKGRNYHQNFQKTLKIVLKNVAVTKGALKNIGAESQKFSSD